MIKRAATVALLATAGVVCIAPAQTPAPEQTIVRAGSQPSTQGPEQSFDRHGRRGPDQRPASPSGSRRWPTRGADITKGA
jgi:hypothetical protein